MLIARLAIISLTTISVLAAPPASADDTTYTSTAHITNIDTGVDIGTVKFSQTGTSVTVNATLENLRPNYPVWVEAYPNRICLPNASFNSHLAGDPSVGIIVADAQGNATFTKTIYYPYEGAIQETASISVRRGDNSSDLDQDGYTGWTDDVGVSQHPRTGLIGCKPFPVRGTF